MDYRDYKAGVKPNHFCVRGRKNLLDVLLLKIKNTTEGRMKILNLGAGTGDDVRTIAKYGDVYVVDIDKDALGMINDKWCFYKGVADARNLPFKSNFFDAVVSFDVFEHIAEDTKAISESRRVLKREGVLLMTVPAFPFMFGHRDKALGHERRYSKEMLRKRLQNFNSFKINYWNCTVFLPVAFLRLIKRDATPKIDDPELPSCIHDLLYVILKIENRLIRLGFPLPFGMTLIAIT